MFFKIQIDDSPFSKPVDSRIGHTRKRWILAVESSYENGSKSIREGDSW